MEVVEGEHAGKRGGLGQLPWKVGSSFIKSSGLDKVAFEARTAERAAASVTEVRDACAQLPQEMRDALAEVRRRVACDELPLLSLLQVEPLRVQASHLSFQEYFAARALCEGAALSGPRPWEWPAWWANTLTIGEGMGEAFGKGLLKLPPQLLSITERRGRGAR